MAFSGWNLSAWVFFGASLLLALTKLLLGHILLFIYLNQYSYARQKQKQITQVANLDYCRCRQHLSDLAPMNDPDVSGQTIKWNVTSLLKTFSSGNCQRESGRGQVSPLPRVSLLIL